MKDITDFIHHFFLPRESNNHRSKLLHHSTLFIIVGLFLSIQFLQLSVETRYPEVLGISHTISPDELLLETNVKRQENGLPVLQMNPELAKAAASKAQDMMSKGYWAHTSPTGTTPWVFIKGSGYEYVFAGENLARGFTSTPDVIRAWMESPGHRENILSKNYNDIGFAIVTGNLNGDETVLIVEMFGSRTSPFVAKETTGSSITPQDVSRVSGVTESNLSPTVLPTSVPAIATDTAPIVVASAQNMPVINARTMAKNISLIVVGLLLIVLAVDLWVTEKRRIVRAVAHNLDHIAFLSAIFIAVLLFTRGFIL